MIKNRKLSRVKKSLFVLIIILLLCVGSSSCSSNPPVPKDVDQPTSANTESPDYENWEQTIVGEGDFSRNDSCPISFSYQYRTLGLLTVAISDNISPTFGVDEIYQKLFQDYNQLNHNSLANFQYPIAIFIIPDTIVENCTSQDSVIFTSPERFEDVPLVENIIGESSGVNEHWIKAGLAYLALGEEVDHQILKNWYQETEDLEMLGLFKAWFMKDWVSQEEVNIARMTAASLIEFCLEHEEFSLESIENEFNNNLRNQWLQFLGVDRSVDYAYDELYDSFELSTSEDCSLILKSEDLNFCLNRLSENPYFDEVHEAEDFIYHTSSGYQAITDYLLAKAPSISQWIGSDDVITVEIKETEQLKGYTQGDTILLQQNSMPEFVLGEVIKTYDWYEKLQFNKTALLLQHGFSEYLGFLLPIYEQPSKIIIWDDINGLESSAGISFWYCLDEEQMAAAKAWYLQQGGSLENEDSIDPRLFTDAVAFATIYRDAHGGALGYSIEKKFEDHIDLSDMLGTELSFTQAASYVAWLCETYSLDTVMAKYVNNDKDTALDNMGYEILKQEWLADLQAKGSGIPIPDSP